MPIKSDSMPHDVSESVQTELISGKVWQDSTWS